MHILSSMILVLLFLGASISDDELARSGKIREDAPVKASLEITIHAPIEKVWLLLTDVRGWPKWQTDISTAEMTGPLQVGTTFSWTTGGTHIKSRVALVQPCNQFAWTGSAFGATAIHLWKLSRVADNQTIVETDESMHGFLLTLFYSSKKLEETDQRWLDRLKLAAESGGSARFHDPSASQHRADQPVSSARSAPDQNRAPWERGHNGANASESGTGSNVNGECKQSP